MISEPAGRGKKYLSDKNIRNTIFRCRFKSYDTRIFITMSMKVVPFGAIRSGFKKR